jgi:hypothetical protein
MAGVQQKGKRWVFLAGLLMAGAFAARAQRPAADSITVSIAPEYNQVSQFHRFLFGESYRKLWTAPVKLKVFRLANEKGGLHIVKQGGGLQTKSVRLEDPTGQQWVLRTVQKYPERGLPENLRKTVARDILQDQVSGAHPYAALTVPPLAEALGLPHSNPQIVYVPDDTALGEYRKEFANGVFLFEEREPLESAKTDNTAKVQQKLQDDNDTRVEQKLVLRARLLDMLLGDWDRHEDQWRWDKKKEKGATVYTPIPRDRDQVYHKPTGVFPWIVSHQWLKSKFQGYHDEIRDINGYNFNQRYFDRYFLNSLDEADWKEQVAFVQHTLTDSLINRAVHLLPDTIFALSGKQIIATFIARRNVLEQQAMVYYHFLAKTVDIPASDKHELLEINHAPEGVLDVTIHKTKKSGKQEQVIYHRRFSPAVTKEIRLYGFAGNDVFTVTGNTPSRIRVRMIGGADEDSFVVSPELHNRSRLYIYDRSDSLNHLPPRRLAKIRLSKDSLVNTFDKQNFQYDRFMPIIWANYNIDYGLMPQVGASYEKHGFRKKPYAMKHQLLGNYSLGRKSFSFTYTGDFKQLVGKNDLVIDVNARGPHNVSNFFGLGNETVFENKGDKKIFYYRNRYDVVTGSVRLQHNFGKWSVYAGLAAQYYNSYEKNNTGHFLAEYNAAHPALNVFNNKVYAGFITGFSFDTRNNAAEPTSGMYWSTRFTGLKQLNEDHVSYGEVLSEYSVYYSPTHSNRLVFADRVGTGTNIGKPAFFQQMHIGGMQNLRGFHSFRFAGKTMLYNNLELRLKLLDFTSYLLPGTLGIIGFNDIGRVWMPGESSGKWHDGYGGGVYIEPANLVTIQGVIGFSKENTLGYVSLGFRF